MPTNINQPTENQSRNQYQDIARRLDKLDRRIATLTDRIQSHLEAEPLADYKEAAEFLGLSVSTVQEWVCYKKIPYYKVGRRVGFKLSELVPFRKPVKTVDPCKELR